MHYIPCALLRPGMVLAVDPLLPEHDAALLRHGTVLTPELVERLKKIDYVDGVFIESIHSDRQNFVNPVLQETLRDNTLVNLHGIFQAALLDSGPAGLTKISALSGTIRQIVTSVKNSKDILVNISDLKDYDDYTYHHCLSVAVLSIATGTQLKMNDKELADLGMSAILHDMGKILVPLDVINKPTRLTNAEFNIIKQHPALGIEYLSHHNLIDQTIYTGISMHHERVDGSGYPFNKTDKDIPLFAKIISIADVYDALTSKRPYREPMQPFEAMEYLMGHCGSAFDWDVMCAFMEKLEIYPKGSFVRLSNGLYYQVLDASKKMLRPIVRGILPPNQIIDLNSMEALSLVVTEAHATLPEAVLNGTQASV